MILFYGYNKCSTCRKAQAYLKQRGIAFKEYDITLTPPSATILHGLLKSRSYQLKELFNRSGELYREMEMAKKLPKMSEQEAVALLSKHGKLVKRPVITDGIKHTVGFDPEKIQSVWG